MNRGTDLRERIRAHYRARPGYWFRPKLVGWGAVPVTWQGWAATLALLAVGVAIARLAEQRSPGYLLVLIPLVLAFAVLAWRKTDGAWAWRWGPDDSGR